MSMHRIAQRAVIGLMLVSLFQATLSEQALAQNASQAERAETDATIPPEQLRVFKWLDQLRFPRVETLRLVRTKRVDRDPECGFVVPELDAWNGPQVLGEDFELHPVDRKKAADNAVENLDLVEHAYSVLNEAQETLAVEQDAFKGSMSIPRSVSRLFFWAWACWRHGHYHLAAQLLSESERLYSTNPLEKRHYGHTEQHQVRRMTSHSEWLEYIIGWDKFGELTRVFGRSGRPRRELLYECAWYLDKFPGSYHRPLVVEFMGELERMLIEDDLHAQSRRPFDELTKEEQIAELIHRLRDQTSTLPFGLPDIFSCRNANTPAHRLLKFGYDAVPHLIDALDDTRVTRVAPYYGNDARDIVRVGECAKAILDRLSLRDLGPTVDYDHELGLDTITVSVADKYREWYSRLLREGEESLWIEGVESGDRDSPQQARKLVEKYPKAAIRAIRTGILRSRDDYTIEGLMQSLAQLPGNEAAAALLDEAKHAAYVTSRVSAAEALWARGNEDGLKTMLIEWAGERVPRGTDRAESIDSFTSADDALPTFLLRIGRIEAVNALARRILTDPEAKCAFLKIAIDFDHDIEFEKAPLRWRNFLPSRIRRDRDPPEAWRTALEELFVDLLDDSEIISGFNFWSETNNQEPIRLDEPSAREVAAYELRRIRPERYEFTTATFEAEPEKVFEYLKRQWAAAQAAKDAGERTQNHQIVLTIFDRIRAWRAFRRPKSEEQQLVEAVERGDADSVAKAQELVAKYPAVALAALRTGSIGADSPAVSASLVAIIARLPGDEPLHALTDEVKRASNVETRIAAARALQRQGHDEGVRAMIAEWSGERPSRATDRDEYSDVEKDAVLSMFLLRCGSVDAIRAFARGLRARSPSQRVKLLSVFDEQPDAIPRRVPDEIPILDDYVAGPLSQFADPNTSGDLKTAIEQTCVALLDDLDVDKKKTAEHPLPWRVANGEDWDFLNLVTPRVCDVAALVLRDLNRERYGFADAELQSMPEEIRIRLKSAWRKAHKPE